MKRIVYFVMIIAACLMLVCPLSIYAEEVETEPAFEVETPAEEATSDNVAITEEEATEATEEEAEPNIFTRVYEAFCDNKIEVFTLGGSGALIALSFILKKKLDSGFSSLFSKSENSSKRQEDIVGGLNEMIDGYEEIKQDSSIVKGKIEKFEALIERMEASNVEVVAKVGEMFTTLVSLINKEMLQNNEVMEVLSTVYTNNEAIPKGIKDFISIMRSENVKIVQEATQLVSNEPSGAEGGEAV